MTNQTVTVAEILSAARAREASLVAESAGHIVLSLARPLGGAALLVDPAAIVLTAEGNVTLRQVEPAPDDGQAAAQLRTVLRALLDASSGAPGPLEAVARPRASERSQREMFAELATALIPINRGAAKRALGRLARETLRAKAAGVLQRVAPAPALASPPEPTTPAVEPPPEAPKPPPAPHRGSASHAHPPEPPQEPRRSAPESVGTGPALVGGATTPEPSPSDDVAEPPSAVAPILAADERELAAPQSSLVTHSPPRDSVVPISVVLDAPDAPRDTLDAISVEFGRPPIAPTDDPSDSVSSEPAQSEGADAPVASVDDAIPSPASGDAARAPEATPTAVDLDVVVAAADGQEPAPAANDEGERLTLLDLHPAGAREDAPEATPSPSCEDDERYWSNVEIDWSEPIRAMPRHAVEVETPSPAPASSDAPASFVEADLGPASDELTRPVPLDLILAEARAADEARATTSTTARATRPVVEGPVADPGITDQDAGDEGSGEPESARHTAPYSFDPERVGMALPAACCPTEPVTAEPAPAAYDPAAMADAAHSGDDAARPGELAAEATEHDEDLMAEDLALGACGDDDAPLEAPHEDAVEHADLVAADGEIGDSASDEDATPAPELPVQAATDASAALPSEETTERNALDEEIRFSLALEPPLEPTSADGSSLEVPRPVGSEPDGRASDLDIDWTDEPAVVAEAVRATGGSVVGPDDVQPAPPESTPEVAPESPPMPDAPLASEATAGAPERGAGGADVGQGAESSRPSLEHARGEQAGIDAACFDASVGEAGSPRPDAPGEPAHGRPPADDILAAPYRTVEDLLDDFGDRDAGRSRALLEAARSLKHLAEVATPTPPALRLRAGLDEPSPLPSPVAGLTVGLESNEVASIPPQSLEPKPLRRPKATLFASAALLALGVASVGALWVHKPELFVGRGSPLAGGVPPSDQGVAAAPVDAVDANTSAPVTLSDLPERHELLLRMGVAPLVTPRLPTGVRLEFVATAPGHQPERVIVPPTATWSMDAKGVRHLAQSAELVPGTPSAWPPAPEGPVGGRGAAGQVEFDASPPGTEIWLVVHAGTERSVTVPVPTDDSVHLMVVDPSRAASPCRLTLGGAELRTAAERGGMSLRCPVRGD